MYLEGTGDFVLGKELDTLGILLDQGVKVALMYGDRDYQCNCESQHRIKSQPQVSNSD